MIAFAPTPRIEPGTRGDYLLLARHHYAAGEPASYARVLRAMEGERLVGVLVVSRPTLNAPWRRRAWPDLAGLSRRDEAAWVNQRLRTITRVIVEPRWRGTGVARRLVRAYLDDPLTTHTEAVAAMAASSPFFERAGMRRVARPISRRDQALARTLRRLGVRPWSLVDLREGERRCRASRPLHDAVRRWASAGKGTRRRLGEPAPILAALAGSSLSARGAVLVWP